MEVLLRYKLFTLLYTAYIHHSVVLSQYSHCLLFLMFWSKKASKYAYTYDMAICRYI